jgi:hypothetical protein
VRTAKKAVLVVLIALVLLGGGGLIWLDRQFRPNPPTDTLPMLVRNLPTPTVEIERAFRQRVQARFADGMEDAVLTKDLRHDGFHLRDYAPGKRMATLEQQDPICTRTWIIYWKIDQGRARDIGAHVNIGCL